MAMGSVLEENSYVSWLLAANNLRTRLRFSKVRQMMKPGRFDMRILLALVLLLGVLFGGRASAYTLLTHEELIDLNWQNSIVPLLLSRYPNLTPAQLQEARYPGHGLLSVWRQIFHKPDPLRALGRLRGESLSQCAQRR
jgi:hypothetical protein